VSSTSVAASGAGTGAPGTGRRQSIMLAVILVTQLMVVLDATVVIVALPKVRTALGFSPSDLSWVQNAYALAFGGLMLLGARAGDILGRRRVFLTGVSLFTIASLLGGLAQTAGMLLAARALQGVGAAIAAPAALTLLIMSFQEGPPRNRALGYYSLVSSGGGSVGLVLGGMLTGWVSWRWGLFINVPIGIALVLVARRYLTETPTRSGRFDAAGALTSTLGITSIVYGLTRVGAHGWGNPTTLTAFAAGVLLLIGFVVVERRAEQPITPLRLFLDRDRSLSYLTMLLVVSAMFGMFFFLSQFLQGVLQFSPLEAGLAFLPLTALLFSMARVVPRLMERVGPARLMITGSVLIVAGMLWLTRIGEGSSYLGAVVGPMVLFGLGAGQIFIPLVSRALSGVMPQDAGAASGLLNVIQQVGGALGLAILVTVYGTSSRSAAAAGDTVHALSEGIGAAFVASLVFAVLTLVVVVVSLRPWARPAVAAGTAAEG
jgi:EmrB/QacA subfamily drug resistance transporter